MFTVAVIGPDGAGKSTVIEGIQRKSPFPIRKIYMGVNPDSLTHTLPTTRLVNYLRGKGKKATKSNPNRAIEKSPKHNGWYKKNTLLLILRNIKSFFFISNRTGEEWYRQLVCWYYLKQRYIVLFDRHFYLDYLAYNLAYPDIKRPIVYRIHDFLLEEIYPRPDLTIYLDAPAEVLFARKGESNVGALRRSRDAYLKISQYVPNFCVVDTTQSPEIVLETVLDHIRLFRE